MRSPKKPVLFRNGPPRSHYKGLLRTMSAAETDVRRGKPLKDAGPIASIKVSNESHARRVGAAMAHLAREGRSVPVTAGSAKALATAMKAVAIARKFLREDEGDLGFSAVVERGEERSVTVLTIVPVAVEVENEVENPYTVSKSTDPSSLSGALAARLREGKTVLARCVGVAPAARAATAVALATGHMETGTVLAFPFFSTEGEGDDRITVLNLCVKAV